MYPSKPNTNAVAPPNDSEHSKLTMQSSTSGEKNGPPTESSYQSLNPSAPLLPSSPYNPAIQNMEPPPYSSVVAQDSSDWRNRSSSFSGGNNTGPYPPAAPYINGAKSTSVLDNQPPYPPGPAGPPPGPNYPTGGYSGAAPYPPGPGSGTGITSQPPYSGSGFIPGPGSQAPYPVAPMPMPGPVDTQRQIGFMAPVTMEPKPGYPPGGYGMESTVIQPAPNSYNGYQGTQQGLIYPMQSAMETRRKVFVCFLVVFFVFALVVLFVIGTNIIASFSW